MDYCCGHLIERGTVTRDQLMATLGYTALSAAGFLGVGSFLLNQNAEESITLAAGGISVILAFITLVVYLGRRKENVSPKFYVGLSVVVNLSILGVFKYYNFFVASAEAALSSLGFTDTSLTTLHVLLPVGISFYTFQTMSYSIDLYRRKIKPCENYLDFALYVTYFPQLVAGPIERAAHLLPKIISPRKIDPVEIANGVSLIAYGMFKKVAIADGVAGSVDSVYGASGAVSGLDISLATLFFALQIYCDFSGYTDIARGTSKLFGIDLMHNFNLPYFSRSPSEFWQRWHISLSSWLRDYLYIPLGGNRGSKYATYKNLSLTMLLGGLWHGAAWNFIVWGAYHGVLLSVYRAIPDKFSIWWRRSRVTNAIVYLGSMVLFFLLTCYGWLLFRAESLSQITEFTHILITDGPVYGGLTIKIPPISAILGIPILLGYEIAGFAKEHEIRLPQLIVTLKPLLTGLMVFIFIASMSAPPTQFIYFQF